MSDYVPHEVVVEILKRLPVQSLVRFTVVSKSWYSIIKSPSFISTHLQHSLSKAQPSLVLLRRFSETHLKEYYSFYSDTSSFTKLTEIRSPFKANYDYFYRVVGTVNGLVCLSDDLFGYMDTIVIWNPLIHKFVNLPRQNFTYTTLGGPHMIVIGFGFDSKENDYKVVRLAYVQQDGMDVLPPKAEIYSLKERSWKVLSGAKGVDLSVVEHFWSQCFLNGNVHWLGFQQTRNAEIQFRNWVLLFNMEDEKFRKMKLPKHLVDLIPLKLSISVIGGYLAVLEYRFNAQRNMICGIWVRKEYSSFNSWTKMYDVEVEQGVAITLGSRNVSDILVAPYGPGAYSGERFPVGQAVSLLSFNPTTRDAEDLGIRGTLKAFYASAYTESLVLIDAEDGIGTCTAAEKAKAKSSNKSYENIQDSSLVKRDGSPLLDTDGDEAESSVEVENHSMRTFLEAAEQMHFTFQLEKLGML